MGNPAIQGKYGIEGVRLAKKHIKGVLICFGFVIYLATIFSFNQSGDYDPSLAINIPVNTPQGRKVLSSHLSQDKNAKSTYSLSLKDKAFGLEFEGIKGKPEGLAVSIIPKAEIRIFSLRSHFGQVGSKSETNSDDANSSAVIPDSDRESKEPLHDTRYTLRDKITTPIIHVDDSNINYSRAKVTLEKPRSSRVNAVLYCAD